jgi:hypothetical protein
MKMSKVICPVVYLGIRSEDGKCRHIEEHIHNGKPSDCGYHCTCYGMVKRVTCLPVKEAKGWALRYLLEKGGE